MAQRLARVRASAADAQAVTVAALRQDGACIVEGMFDCTTIATMRASVLRKAERDAGTDARPGSASQGYIPSADVLTEQAPDWISEFVGVNTVRFSSLGSIGGVETRDAYFRMLDNPLYKGVADDILLPFSGTYWVNTAQAMLIGPNSPAQPLHRDADNWSQMFERTWAGSQTPDLTVSAIIALEEVTAEMGATRLVLGSNRDGSPGSSHEDNAKSEAEAVAAANGGNPDYTKNWAAEAVAAELQPGDAVIYSGSVLHAGGANTTRDRWRVAMHLSFVVGWLTPEEASPLDYTTAELEECGASDHVRQVLGHRSYDPSHTRNPIGQPGGGGGLWLRHVRKIEDYVFSGEGTEAGPRLRTVEEGGGRGTQSKL